MLGGGDKFHRLGLVSLKRPEVSPTAITIAKPHPLQSHQFGPEKHAKAQRVLAAIPGLTLYRRLPRFTNFVSGDFGATVARRKRRRFRKRVQVQREYAKTAILDTKRTNKCFAKGRNICFHFF